MLLMSETSESERSDLERWQWRNHLVHWQALAGDMLEHREQWPEERWDEFGIQTGCLMGLVAKVLPGHNLLGMAELTDLKMARSMSTPESLSRVMASIPLIDEAIRSLPLGPAAAGPSHLKLNPVTVTLGQVVHLLRWGGFDLKARLFEEVPRARDLVLYIKDELKEPLTPDVLDKVRGLLSERQGLSPEGADSLLIDDAVKALRFKGPSPAPPPSGTEAAKDTPEAVGPPDEIVVADALAAKGFTLESAFVRHFKGRRTTTWQEIVEAVCGHDEEREWGTVKTWVNRVKNALLEVDPRCRLSFRTSNCKHQVIKEAPAE
jgi:hypothetical protein